jgi:hypothetical protein
VAASESAAAAPALAAVDRLAWHGSRAEQKREGGREGKSSLVLRTALTPLASVGTISAKT